MARGDCGVWRLGARDGGRSRQCGMSGLQLDSSHVSNGSLWGGRVVIGLKEGVECVNDCF